eukprot:scaffold26739_cov34-Attheya_sp.AAC.2
MTASLFGYFSENGIEFTINDFNYVGGWNTALLEDLNKLAESDGTRTFGCKSTKGKLDKKYNQKIYDAHQLNCYKKNSVFTPMLLKICRRRGLDKLITQGLVHRMVHPEVVDGDFVEARGFKDLGPRGGIGMDKDARMQWNHECSKWDNNGVLSGSHG